MGAGRRIAGHHYAAGYSLVIYTMYPPEIKKVDNKTIAKRALPNWDR